MNILQIYQKYYIPKELQMHMLRVAACANLILDNWKGAKLEKESIIRILLLHDMGNIVKITPDQNNDPEFLKNREKWIQKCGEDDNKITEQIAKQEGLTSNEIEIMSKKSSKNNEKTAKSNSYEVKICAYCDQRVAPNGVLGIKERLEDAKKRYKNRPNYIWSNEEIANDLIECAMKIENQIMEYCTIKPNEINDKTIADYIEKLKKYDIREEKK